MLAGLIIMPVAAAAQDSAETSAHVRQAEPSSALSGDASKVYFPDAITPQSVAAARKRAAEQEQLTTDQASEDASQGLEQVARSDDGDAPLVQLTDPANMRDLAQLSEAERQVLLEAIDGTDICDNPPAIEAIRLLCRDRIETRSSDFAWREANKLSAEERLLGEALEDTGPSAINRVIERLARNSGSARSFEDQAVASIAFGRPADPGGAAADGVGEAGSDLSPETQQLINALIQQLGDGGGG